jgi:hypothetical protein
MRPDNIFVHVVAVKKEVMEHRGKEERAKREEVACAWVCVWDARAYSRLAKIPWTNNEKKA